MDDSALWTYLSWTIPPIWAWVLIYALRTFKEWPAIMARRNEARRDNAAASDALLGRYETRMAALERAEEKCRHDLADAAHRIAELEGYMIGQGKANQEAAGIVAVERLTNRETPKRGGGTG